MESDADKSFSQSTLQQTAQKRRHNNDAVIEQREQEINDIAKGIIELADIFKDLQTMVIDQGTMLDRIDYNVERMAVDVKEAEKELTVGMFLVLASFLYIWLSPAMDINDNIQCQRADFQLHRPQTTRDVPQSARYFCYSYCWSLDCSLYSLSSQRSETERPFLCRKTLPKYCT